MSPTYQSEALTKALAQIDRANGGKPVPLAEALRSAPYKPPVYRPSLPVSERTRKANLAKLATWVRGQRITATTKTDPEAFLQDKADHLGRVMSLLGPGCHAAYRGLNAFDLGEAQTALLAPVAVNVKRVA